MAKPQSIIGANVAVQGNAQGGLLANDAAASSAGGGLYSNGRLICPTWNAWNGMPPVLSCSMLPGSAVSPRPARLRRWPKLITSPSPPTIVPAR